MVHVGLDIGGTKTAALVASSEGRELGEATVPTNVTSPNAVVESARQVTTAALEYAGLELADVISIGAGIPGQVDRELGTVRMAVNLNLTDSYPLALALEEALGRPVVLENDVRAAALGAYHWLASTKPVNSLAYLSIGTGIAAGIVVNGQLYRGAHGMAGEIGHIPVDPAGPRCACGAYGCLEAVAAGPAIAAYATEVLTEAHSAPVLSTLDVYTLAGGGNQAARHVIDRASYFLARAIYLLVMTYDVEKIILGGGVTRAGVSFQRPLEKALDEVRQGSPLAAAMLPEDKILVLPSDYNAGLRGAVLLAQQLAVTPT